MQVDIEFVRQVTDGALINGEKTLPITGVTTDSRQVSPGDIFFALEGEKFDGHNYISQALASGATAVVVSKLEPSYPGNAKAGILLVADTVQALQDLAAAWRRRFELPLIAITGSVGKTTTRDILGSCLATRWNTLKTEANYNNDIGLPLTLLRLDETHQAAVVELAMRGRGEIQRLTRAARPTAAIITNVEPVHLETLGSLDNIAMAKCEILESIRDFALINGDSPWLIKAAANYSCRQYSFGYNEKCDFQLHKVEVGKQGLHITARMQKESAVFDFAVPARKLAANVMAAAAAAYLYGLDIDDIRTGLSQYRPTGNRLKITHMSSGGILINDTYNANPVSMAAALETGREMAGEGRFIAVLGDMYELGDYEAQGHREVGCQAARLEIDMLITIGDKGRLIADEAINCGLLPQKVYHFPVKEDSIPLLREKVSQRDTVLFKASRGMQLETLIDAWLNQY